MPLRFRQFPGFFPTNRTILSHYVHFLPRTRPKRKQARFRHILMPRPGFIGHWFPMLLGKDDHNHCSSLHLAVLRIVSLPEVLCQDILLHIVGKALLQAIKPIHYTPPSFPVLFFISNRKINHCSSSTGAVLPHRRQSSG